MSFANGPPLLPCSRVKQVRVPNKDLRILMSRVLKHEERRCISYAGADSTGRQRFIRKAKAGSSTHYKEITSNTKNALNVPVPTRENRTKYRMSKVHPQEHEVGGATGFNDVQVLMLSKDTATLLRLFRYGKPFFNKDESETPLCESPTQNESPELLNTMQSSECRGSTRDTLLSHSYMQRRTHSTSSIGWSGTVSRGSLSTASQSPTSLSPSWKMQHSTIFSALCTLSNHTSFYDDIATSCPSSMLNTGLSVIVGRMNQGW